MNPIVSIHHLKNVEKINTQGGGTPNTTYIYPRMYINVIDSTAEAVHCNIILRSNQEPFYLCDYFWIDYLILYSICTPNKLQHFNLEMYLAQHVPAFVTTYI